MPDISYGMDESKKGEYVLYKDYAKLKAENERLRKAGDAMAGVLGLPINKTQEQALNKAWLAAKGVQS
jgi:hypothetical protein